MAARRRYPARFDAGLEGEYVMSVQELPLEDELRENHKLEQTATSSSALYEHWERHQWSSLAIDLSVDAATFQLLDQAERDGLVWMFANRFHAEFNVARLLAPFLLAAPDYEMQLLLATQVADEHRHLQRRAPTYPPTDPLGPPQKDGSTHR
jgi:hypothetical protein